MTNIVLVHGAWADGSSWSRVIPLLHAVGHHVVAVQLPLTSLADDVAVTRRVLETIDGPLVVAGHSYGGAVISGAATDVPAVAALVFVAAYAPQEGETLGDINDRFPPTPGLAAIRPDGHDFLWFDQAAMPAAFAADVDETYARVMASVQTPIAAASLGEPAGRAAWQHVPSWYLISENDLIIHPDAERWMAERMQATQSALPASHASLVSHPTEVAEVILSAADSVRARDG